MWCFAFQDTYAKSTLVTSMKPYLPPSQGTTYFFSPFQRGLQATLRVLESNHDD